MSLACRGYERMQKRLDELEALEVPLPPVEEQSDYGTEEAENRMNNTPSPNQKDYYYWNPEYEARRQARKVLWSPPLTPDPDEPHRPSYSLQPSQRPPSSPSHRPRRHRQQHSSPRQQNPSLYQPVPINPTQPPGSPIRHLPQKAQSKIRKPKRPTMPCRPITRSMKALQEVALDNKRGQVVLRSSKGELRIASFGETRVLSIPFSPVSNRRTRTIQEIEKSVSDGAKDGQAEDVSQETDHNVNLAENGRGDEDEAGYHREDLRADPEIDRIAVEGHKGWLGSDAEG
ncbi:MAG: hypothetical protein Q9167_005717 [Letrouitia subvulpina]